MEGETTELALRRDRENMPRTFEDKIKWAGVLAKSGLLPNGLDTPEKVFVALQWGAELGLSPMVAVHNIAVISGKPTLSADIMNAIASSHPEYGGCVWEEMSAQRAKCVVTRNRAGGVSEKFPGEFTWNDAATAGLANKDNWKKYPQRMLKHRALSFALRDAFPDALAGVYTPDEAQNVENVRNITDEAVLSSAIPEQPAETPVGMPMQPQPQQPVQQQQTQPQVQQPQTQAQQSQMQQTQPQQVQQPPQQQQIPQQSQPPQQKQPAPRTFRPLTQEEADELNMMFHSGHFSKDEYEDAVYKFNIREIGPDVLMDETRRKYNERRQALNNAFDNTRIGGAA